MQKHANIVDIVKRLSNEYFPTKFGVDTEESPVKFGHLAENSEQASIPNLNQLRSQPECATATSVEECDGYEQAPPYTTFLKTLESEFRCSGFSGPAVQILNSHGNLGIGIGIFARPIPKFQIPKGSLPAAPKPNFASK